MKLMTRYGLASTALIGALTLAACSGSPMSSLTPTSPSSAASGSASFSPNPLVCDSPNVINESGECVPPPPPPPPPTGDQGCTPGFWKANAKKGGSEWPPLTPSQKVSTLFIAGSFNNNTLLEALEFGGGAGLDGAKRNLLRAAVAAYLNAANGDVAYPRTTGGIVAAVNAALGSTDRDAILALAAALDADNNLGCPLNNN